MDLSSINPILLVASIMVSATPILLAAIGEMVVEKSGVLNLGVEGMMITGAVIGFVLLSPSIPARRFWVLRLLLSRGLLCPLALAC